MRSLMPKWFAAMTAVSVAVVAYGTWQSLTAGDNSQSEKKQAAAVEEINALVERINYNLRKAEKKN